MYAHLLVDASVPTANQKDTVDKALQIMEENCLRALPVIEQDDTYLGIVKEDILLDVPQTDMLIEDFIIYSNPVIADEHILNVIKNNDLLNNSILPVINSDKRFIGSISKKSALQFINQNRSIQQSGGVIVLEMKANDYAMSEISRLVESNNSSIVFSYISDAPKEGNIWITLKINKIDLKEVVQTFERFNYQIAAVYQVSELKDIIQERYDSLMMYLNV